MTEIEKKALALVNEEREGRPYSIDEAKREYGWCFQAVCRAIEQHEAFRQEVSDAVEEYTDRNIHAPITYLGRFILPKPDPLVEAVKEASNPDYDCASPEAYAEVLRAAIAARGLKIVEDK